MNDKNKQFQDVIESALAQYGKAIILQSDAGSNAALVVKGQLELFLPLLKGEKSNDAHLECCLIAAQKAFESGLSVKSLLSRIKKAPFAINNPSGFKQFIDRHLRILEKLPDGSNKERSFEGGRICEETDLDFLGL